MNYLKRCNKIGQICLWLTIAMQHILFACLHTLLTTFQPINHFHFHFRHSEKKQNKANPSVFIPLIRNAVCGRKYLRARGSSKQVKSHDTKIQATNETKKRDHQPSHFACIAIYYYDTWMDGERILFGFRRFHLHLLMQTAVCMTFELLETDMDTLDTNNNWFYAYEKYGQVTKCPIWPFIAWLISMFCFYFGANRINCAASIFKVNRYYVLCDVD